MNNFKYVIFSSSLFFSNLALSASVDLKLDIKFDSNRTEIKAAGQEPIKLLQKISEALPNAKILISGHTDSTGADDYNQMLSEQRARAVRDALVDQGVSENIISFKGFGESAPVKTNSTRSGRAENRRVVASLLRLTNQEAKKVPFLINGALGESGVSDITIVENESAELQSFKDSVVTEDIQEDVEEEVVEIIQPEVVEDDAPKSLEDSEMETSEVETSLPEEPEVRKTLRRVTRKPERQRYYATLMVGPHWSSKYYEGDVSYEHGKLTYLSYGVDLGVKLSKRWFMDGYFYYLPTEINEANSGLDFTLGESIKYENNIYGLRAGYIFRGGETYRLSFIGGLTSHIISGLERSGVNAYEFQKYEHIGITLGLRLEKKLSKNWAFDSDLAYILPVSVGGAHDASGKLWYRGLLGVKRRISKRWRLALEYQAVYHESEFTYASGYKAKPEFFIQTVMAGAKYRF